jgi:hypothetical protein
MILWWYNLWICYILGHFRVVPAQPRPKIRVVPCHPSCWDSRHDITLSSDHTGMAQCLSCRVVLWLVPKYCTLCGPQIAWPKSQLYEEAMQSNQKATIRWTDDVLERQWCKRQRNRYTAVKAKSTGTIRWTDVLESRSVGWTLLAGF